VRATDGLHARFGEAEVLDLPLLDQILHRACDVLDRHVRVDPVLIEEVDRVYPEASERTLDGLAKVLRTAVHARRPLHAARVQAGTEVEPEFGGDHDLRPDGRQGGADELLVDERPVDLGGVEEGNAVVDGGTQQRGHLPRVLRRAVGEAHAHAAEADRRNFEVARAERTRPHA
jgi:hypothetical protein